MVRETTPLQIINVLLVEDNPGDVRLLEETFKSGSALKRLNAVPDGIEALKYLRREASYADAERPDLILLDLNLPRKDGRELLAEIKKDHDLCRIPVIVLTTSNSESDVKACYQLHSNCYLVKPLDFETFSGIVTLVEDFWMKTVRLPGRMLVPA